MAWTIVYRAKARSGESIETADQRLIQRIFKTTNMRLAGATEALDFELKGDVLSGQSSLDENARPRDDFKLLVETIKKLARRLGHLQFSLSDGQNLDNVDPLNIGEPEEFLDPVEEDGDDPVERGDLAGGTYRRGVGLQGADLAARFVDEAIKAGHIEAIDGGAKTLTEMLGKLAEAGGGAINFDLEEVLLDSPALEELYADGDELKALWKQVAD